MVLVPGFKLGSRIKKDQRRGLVFQAETNGPVRGGEFTGPGSLGLVTVLRRVPSSGFGGGSRCAFFVALVDLHTPASD